MWPCRADTNIDGAALIKQGHPLFLHRRKQAEPCAAGPVTFTAASFASNAPSTLGTSWAGSPGLVLVQPPHNPMMHSCDRLLQAVGRAGARLTVQRSSKVILLAESTWCTCGRNQKVALSHLLICSCKHLLLSQLLLQLLMLPNSYCSKACSSKEERTIGRIAYAIAAQLTIFSLQYVLNGVGTDACKALLPIPS